MAAREASGREAEYMTMGIGHERTFEPFGNVSKFWTKWWSEVLLPKGQS